MTPALKLVLAGFVAANTVALRSLWHVTVICCTPASLIKHSSRNSLSRSAHTAHAHSLRCRAAIAA
jgi:hypothetical protein